MPDRADRPDPKAVRYDVAIVGGGIAGMATAARLQARGCSTIVFEAHGQPGGCAGFFRRNGFAFDVGATTLVDFAPGGVGGELLESIGMPPLEAEDCPAMSPGCPTASSRCIATRPPGRTSGCARSAIRPRIARSGGCSTSWPPSSGAPAGPASSCRSRTSAT